MILATYKSEAHPPGPIDCPGVGTVRYRAGYRPYRTWAAVHLRVLREQRTGEISGR